MLVNQSQPICAGFNQKVNYLKAAEAFGLPCQRLDDHNDIEAVPSDALNHNDPSFIEMAIVSQEVTAQFEPKWVQSAR